MAGAVLNKHPYPYNELIGHFARCEDCRDENIMAVTDKTFQYVPVVMCGAGKSMRDAWIDEERKKQ